MNFSDLYFNFNSDRSLVEKISKNFQEYLPVLLLRGMKQDSLPKLLTSDLTEAVKQKYFGHGEIIDNPQAFTRVRHQKMFNIRHQNGICAKKCIVAHALPRICHILVVLKYLIQYRIVSIP